MKHMHKKQSVTVLMENQVKLISSDNVEFSIDVSLAQYSKTIEIFLDPKNHFIQSQTKVVKLPIKTKYLKRILEFMRYASNQQKCSDVFEFRVLEEETNELLEIASYLRI